MIILGLHAFTHDSAAALAVDGRLAAFAQEERWSRIKGDGAFPRGAVEFCLRDAGVDPREIDRVVLPFRPWIGAVQRLAYQFRRLRRGPAAAVALLGRGRDNLGLTTDLRRAGIEAPVVRTDHHAAHARAVFAASGYERAAILVLDGVAEAWSGGVFTARRSAAPDIECLRRFPFPASAGLVYAAVTEHLGLRHNREEGTVMAMAALGDESLIEPMERTFGLREGRLFVERAFFDFGGEWTTPAFAHRFCPRRERDDPFEARHFALARAVQTVVEKLAVEISRDLLASTGARCLCLTGGLALNPALNGVVVAGSGADEVFLLPVGGDAGTAIGAALTFEADPSWRLEHPFRGSKATENEIDRALSAAGLSPTVTGSAVVDRTAGLLADGAIGGWFCGRSEMGPRALGHRSILADPRRGESATRLNATVKKRQPFRPFAPSVLLSAADRYFPGLGPSPLMLRTVRVASGIGDLIPAVVHVDGTARPQTVDDDDRSGLAPLLRAFGRRTGVPLLLNTSLNRRGEPPAERPEDAVAIYLETGLDFLVLEDRLVIRE